MRLFLIAVFLLPLQLEVDAFKNVVGSRLPPGDFFMAMSVLLAPASFRVMRSPLGFLPLLLPLTLAYGLLAALVVEGAVTNHAVNVKFLGSLVLVVTGVVTMAYAREGYTRRILRSLLLGIAVAGLVAYIDWKYFDIVPTLSAGGATRFEGFVSDPNNAGALFGTALVLSWRYGHRLFSRTAWIAMTIGFAVGLAVTLSRGGLISTGAGIVTVLIVDHVSAERYMRYLAAAAAIAGIVIANGYVDSAVDDWTRRPDTVTSRGSFVDYSMEQWVESGGIGMGLGTFRADTGRIVHNTAVWLVSEMSIPGLLFYLVVGAVPFHACLRMRTYDHELALALLAAHVTMLVASVGIEALYQRIWWVIIGMTVLPVLSVRNEQQAAAALADDEW